MARNYIYYLAQMSASCSALSHELKDAKGKNEDFDDFIESDLLGMLLSPIEAGFDLYKAANLNFFPELEPAIQEILSLQQYEDFEDFLSTVDFTRSMLNLNKELINDFCSSFDDEEKERLNESVHDYLEDCHYSSVAMSVSAVESRLYKLMNGANPNDSNSLEKLTLGRLIVEYMKNPEKYNNCVPAKHNHLLNLCNEYRIFSVHPKGHQINRRMASSILNLAFEFLVDSDTKPDEKDN